MILVLRSVVKSADIWSYATSLNLYLLRCRVHNNMKPHIVNLLGFWPGEHPSANEIVEKISKLRFFLRDRIIDCGAYPVLRKGQYKHPRIEKAGERAGESCSGCKEQFHALIARDDRPSMQ